MSVEEQIGRLAMAFVDGKEEGRKEGRKEGREEGREEREKLAADIAAKDSKITAQAVRIRELEAALAQKV